MTLSPGSSEISPTRFSALSSRVSPSGREVGYEMSNGAVSLNWGQAGGTWQITSLTTAQGTQGFLPTAMWRLTTRPSGVTEMLFPVLKVRRISTYPQSEKLFLPLLGGAIRRNPSETIGVFGEIDAAELEAAGIQSLDGVSLVELANPGPASMQFTALYDYDASRGFYLQTDDLGARSKVFGFGSALESTLMLVRHYTTDTVVLGEPNTSLSPNLEWDVAFASLGGGVWTVTWTQKSTLTVSGTKIPLTVVDQATPDRLELSDPVTVTMTVTLVGDEARLGFSVSQGGRARTVPYSVRMTYMAGRLYEFCQRYRSWVTGANPQWMQTPISTDLWWISERERTNAVLSVGYGASGTADVCTEFADGLADWATLMTGGDAGAVSSYWQDWHSEDASDAVEGAYWPDLEFKETAQAAVAQARAAGFAPGFYLLPNLYDRNSTTYDRDGAATLAHVGADGEIRTSGGGVYTLRDRISLKLGLETMFRRWRHSWIDAGHVASYHDALSGLQEDGWPEQNSAIGTRGGTGLSAQGIREWLLRSMRDQGRPVDPLHHTDGSQIEVSGTGAALEVSYDAQLPYLEVSAGGGAALQISGTDDELHVPGPRTLTLDHTDGSALEVSDGGGATLDLSQPHRHLPGVCSRIENPAEHLLGIALIHAMKFNFVAALGFLPVDKAWAWVYNERAITGNITDNPILRPTAASPDPFSVLAARIFSLLHVGQYHAGMMVTLSAFSSSDSFAPPTPSGSRGDGETILYGKIEQLTALDLVPIVREARQLGRHLKPPGGFFWDAYESETGVDSKPIMVDLFKHPTLDRVLLLVSNISPAKEEVTVTLSADDYPDLVGRTRLNDAITDAALFTFQPSQDSYSAHMRVEAQTTKGYIFA